MYYNNSTPLDYELNTNQTGISVVCKADGELNRD